VLHLLAHGAFKALLFLSAGAVVHAVGGATTMDRMGGLRRHLPDTFATMTLGFAALAGVVPMVGFFTKDAVIGGALEEAREGRLVWGWAAWVLVVCMVLTAVMTVAYSLRAWLLVFFGPERVDAPADLHDAPASMRVPLYLLAVPTVLGGLMVVDPAAILGPEHDEHLVHGWESVVMTGLVAATVVAVLLAYRRHGREMWHKVVLPHPPVDWVYDRVVVRPVRGMAQAVRVSDRDVVDGWASGAAGGVRVLGGLLRRAQGGNVQAYVMVVVLGAVAVAVAAGVMA
jgi:NADH-quinone oxidoreductase subunit L